jgi:hypothetical protein
MQANVNLIQAKETPLETPLHAREWFARSSRPQREEEGRWFEMKFETTRRKPIMRVVGCN